MYSLSPQQAISHVGCEASSLACIALIVVCIAVIVHRVHVCQQACIAVIRFEVWRPTHVRAATVCEVCGRRTGGLSGGHVPCVLYAVKQLRRVKYIATEG